MTSFAVRTMAGQGRLPFRRVGGGPRARYGFRRSDVRDLAARRLPRHAEDRPIGTQEAARVLGVAPSTVLYWAAQGKLPATRLAAAGRLPEFRFSRADIEAFMERSSIRPERGANGLAPNDA